MRWTIGWTPFGVWRHVARITPTQTERVADILVGELFETRFVPHPYKHTRGYEIDVYVQGNSGRAIDLLDWLDR